jgi:heme-degrading monooxygenase HmoA
VIVRVWRGWTSAADATVYARHAIERVFPSLEKIEGYRGGTLLQRSEEGRTEFIVLTKWDSLTAVRRFAGEDVGRAVIEPAALKVLSEYDTLVRHYELVHRVTAE